MAAINPVTVDELLKFAPPVADGTDANAAAEYSLQAAHALVDGYTRGNSVNPFDEYRPGVREVILTVAARILANPGQISMQVTAGRVTVRKGAGYQGFNLGELAVLNRYRRRAVGP